MSGRAALPLLLALALPGAAVAQPAADKVRLDDFALPPAARAPVEQVGPARDLLPRADKGDRILAVPAPPAAAPAPLPQLATPEGVRQSAQIGPDDRSVASAPALSSRRDSRPRHSAPLTGPDRCDPQDPAARSEQCRRILEARANDFTAREAPVLSAEERLIVEQRLLENDTSLQREMPPRAMRDFGNVDDRASQELAAIVIGTAPERPPQRPEAPSAPVPESTLGDVLQAIIIGASPPPTP